MTTELVPKLDLADVPLPAIIADIVEFTGSSESPIFQQGISEVFQPDLLDMYEDSVTFVKLSFSNVCFLTLEQGPVTDHHVLYSSREMCWPLVAGVRSSGEIARAYPVCRTWPPCRHLQPPVEPLADPSRSTPTVAFLSPTMR